MDTMATAWRKSRDLRDPSAIRAWLLQITIRLALSRRRRIGTPLLALPEDDDRLPTSPAPTLDRLMLADAMATLPAQMRAAVVLHYFADLTVNGAAQVLGKSPNTVKAQLREALSRLRVAVSAEPEHRVGQAGTSHG